MSMIERGHLGGYIAGGDEATWYPDMWRWLVETHGVDSVLDIGCGDGQAVKFFESLGCEVTGIDGVAQEHDSIVEHDFTTGSIVADEYDLVWSCEFVEHVEERYVPNFMEAFKHGRMVLMTHADPGQAGYHHVNCQPAAYWVGVMAAAGYVLDDALTMASRAKASMNVSPWNHYWRSGMAFVRA